MSSEKRPDWRSLYQTAYAQAGFFRLAQAVEAGFSKQLLRKHVLAGRFQRALRGVYRLADMPPADQSELVGLWLWSAEIGVFSHETALALHGVSDALPSRIHMTVPRSWRRTDETPPLLMLHVADLPAHDRTWIGSVPVTTLARTVRDAFDAGVDPTFIVQAIQGGAARGQLARDDLRGITKPVRGRPKGARGRGFVE